MSTPNVPLLRQTLAHIENNPGEWNQKSYRCRTGMCFAGWAVTLDGGRWATEPTGPHRENLIAVPDDPALVTFEGDGMHMVDVVDRAQRILGLTESQAFNLFDADNDIDDLRNIVAQVGGGE